MLSGCAFHTPFPHIKQIKPRDMPLYMYYTTPGHGIVLPTTRTTAHHYPHYSTQHQLKISYQCCAHHMMARNDSGRHIALRHATSRNRPNHNTQVTPTHPTIPNNVAQHHAAYHTYTIIANTNDISHTRTRTIESKFKTFCRTEKPQVAPH